MFRLVWEIGSLPATSAEDQEIIVLNSIILNDRLLMGVVYAHFNNKFLHEWSKRDYYFC